MSASDQSERVYFIRTVGDPCVVKVGSSRLPETRLGQLSPWSPYELELMATFPGGMREERAFHRLLEPAHSHSEWFRLTPFVRGLIAEVGAGAFDASRLIFDGPTPCRKPRVYRPSPWGPVARIEASMRSQLRPLRLKGVRVPPAVNTASWHGTAENVALVRAYLLQHGRDLNAKAMAALADAQPIQAAA